MNQTIKTALVTGAAQGLGLAIAEELAASGYNLILLDRKEEQLQKAADQIRQQGHLVHTRVIDLSQTEEIKPIIDDIGQTVGQLHVLVNNAGVNQVKPMDQVTSADWDFVMNV
ncbi:SDR family NAD(P)-dependent oxidoreductase, partial [Frankia sp. Cpl3]|nr:SDR family NAD(P)-dependent oxidoreductase [Frankia sp. Cpl3]